MLAASVQRNSVAPFRRTVRGLIDTFSDRRFDGTPGVSYEFDTGQRLGVLASELRDKWCVSGLVQRPATMEIGLAVSPLNSLFYGGFVDIFGAGSRLNFTRDTFLGSIQQAIAPGDNVFMPLKLDVTLASVKVSSESYGSVTYAVVGPQAASIPLTYARNPLAGPLTNGVRYDAYTKNVVACASNFATFEKLFNAGSLRITITTQSFVYAPVVYNVGTDGRIVFDMGDKTFPAKFLIEAFAGPNATGPLYARMVAPVYGGDTWTGRYAPPISGPALARGAWILSAYRSGGGALTQAVDGIAATGWATGGAINVALDYFIIDMVVPQTIGAITLANATFDGTPASGDIYTSLDGVAYTLATSWNATDITQPARLVSRGFVPRVARYIKILPTAQAEGGSQWVIREINLYASAP